MEDQGILSLYFARSEQAIQETDKKYGAYCYSIAYNILFSREDSEESVSDAYFTAWNTIPPRRPSLLRVFLGKVTRHISIDRWRSHHAQKRGGGQVPLALEELLLRTPTPKGGLSLDIYTQEDGNAQLYASDISHLCQGGILAVSDTDPTGRGAYHAFYRCTPTGTELLERIVQDPITLYWGRIQQGQEGRTVSKEEAQAVLDSYQKIEPAWKPLEAYPAK